MGHIEFWVVFLVIGNSIKLQKMVLEAKIRCITSSHSGQWHKLFQYFLKDPNCMIYGG
jgi:hypothetical protein